MEIDLPVKISIRGGDVEVKATVRVGTSEEVVGDQGTGDYYVDEIVLVELALDDELYRVEVEAEADKMLESGELCDMAKEEAEAV